MTTPAMIYGTAWKEDATAGLVRKAIEAGFRAIDTANQKKHYREDYAGEVLGDPAALGLRREDLFFQSKYTYIDGQDHRLPYDPRSDYATQVRDSFASTLKNLHTDYIDSYLLHGPRSSDGMTPADWEVWTEMEKLRDSGQARKIGISNTALRHLQELLKKARIKPDFVQNRCYAIRGWDKPVREFCRANGIIYQGFSLLTANPGVVMSREVASIAGRLHATPAQIIFAFSARIGILPLTGTSDPRHMREDLAAEHIRLSDEDVAIISSL